jgi:hypothetical protein
VFCKMLSLKKQKKSTESINKKIQLKKKHQIDDDNGADDSESESLADRPHDTTIESGDDD